MENKTTFFEPLFERAEAYGKTSYELIKLRTVKKTVIVTSAFVSRSIAFLILCTFIVFLSIGVSFWLGDLLGKMYYGFFCVAGFYAILGFIIYFFLHDEIKKQVGDSIIKHMFN